MKNKFPKTPLIQQRANYIKAMSRLKRENSRNELYFIFEKNYQKRSKVEGIILLKENASG